MAGFSRRLIACLQTGKLAFLALLVASGIVLQACAVYNNWWPMLTAVMYVILPMPLLFFAGSDSSSLMSSDSDSHLEEGWNSRWRNSSDKTEPVQVGLAGPVQ
ncbi:Vacuolar protein sorting-associated protein 55 like [Dendrobium catenatum]|uniref:Vacuolar protein sorting-associated protein 55 like n=1 Tax=Dendrobium catenatum TaxID=906689 RepID=A0A2I0X498_9ASPA|nr:Vacuolar protein sorting-associated protein 55 like [Dendrobium catenatum]